MIAEWYFFMLTTLDAHTIDLEDFKVNKVQLLVHLCSRLIGNLFSLSGLIKPYKKLNLL